MGDVNSRIDQLRRENIDWQEERAAVDQAAIENELVQLGAGFLRLRDRYPDVHPEPVPHVHEEHEHTARRCRWARPFLFYSGISLAVGLTVRAVDGWMLMVVYGALAALLIYGLEGLGTVALHRIRHNVFDRRFSFILAPPVALIVFGLLVFILERVASGDLADVLLTLHPWAWAALEFGLVSAAATCDVANDQLGESGRITRRYEELQAKLAGITPQPKTPRPGSRASAGETSVSTMTSVILLALLLLTHPVFAQTFMIDRTGSIYDQAGVESQLINLIAEHNNKLPNFNVVLYGDHVFAAPTHRFEFSPADTHSDFIPLRHAAERRYATEVAQAIRALFEQKLSAATCTSIADVAERAALETGAVFVLTDGRDDVCSHTTRLARPTPAAGRVIFVLVRATKDQPDDRGVFAGREAHIQALLPGVTVYRQFQFRQALAEFLSAVERQRGQLVVKSAPRGF